MNTLVKFENLKELTVELRGESVLLDSDVANIYGVETKRVNEAVKNNPDKFPDDYLFEISEGEFLDLRSKFSTTKFAKTRALPKAFTEKGLYENKIITIGINMLRNMIFGVVSVGARHAVPLPRDHEP